MHDFFFHSFKHCHHLHDNVSSFHNWYFIRFVQIIIHFLLCFVFIYNQLPFFFSIFLFSSLLDSVRSVYTLFISPDPDEWYAYTWPFPSQKTRCMKTNITEFLHSLTVVNAIISTILQRLIDLNYTLTNLSLYGTIFTNIQIIFLF